MKAGLVMCGPDVAYGPLALLSGTFEEKTAKAAELGYDGIELMVRDPAGLDWPTVKTTLEEARLEVPQIVTGELAAITGLEQGGRSRAQQVCPSTPRVRVDTRRRRRFPAHMGRPLSSCRSGPGRAAREAARASLPTLSGRAEPDGYCRRA